MAHPDSTVSRFPKAELERRLTEALTKIADDAALVRPDWEPLLDSQRIIGTVLLAEDVIPWCPIPPDRVVRKGGYESVEEAVEDMVGRIERIVIEAGGSDGS